MRIYFAPLEGVTNAVFRRAHKERFAGVDKYFMPFTSPSSHLTFNSRVQYELSPAVNEGITVVPQILAKDAFLFNETARLLRDSGYSEVNLNLGCPSSTVTAKRKGSGMLADIDALRHFLDEIYKSPALNISIKTRIGLCHVDEWPDIAAVYRDYPIYELIVHPRTKTEMYSGEPHFKECLSEIETATFPVIPNGNIFSCSDAKDFCCAYPKYDALMLGRGLVANPALAREIAGGNKLTQEELRGFHDALCEAYMLRWQENAVVGRMHEFMNYASTLFENPEKPLKAIRKSKTIKDYLIGANRLFDECRLNENAGYRPL